MKTLILFLTLTVLVVSCQKDETTSPQTSPSPTSPPPGGGIVTNPGAGVTFDGYTYSSIVLGNGQEWMAENLKTTTYANGDPIPIGPNQWQQTTTGVWAHYETYSPTYGISTYDSLYGKLYNWYAVDDSRNVCPTGWHVPSDDEWHILIDYLGGILIAGSKMKSTGIQFWESPNQDATNESFFSGLPGGYKGHVGTYEMMGYFGYWWSSEDYGSQSGGNFALHNQVGTANTSSQYKVNGLSVRCLRD